MPKTGVEQFRRKQVMVAVIAVIADHGIESLTMDKVAKQANVSKGVVTYYFQNKKDLLLQSFRFFLQRYNRIIEDFVHKNMSAMEMMDLVIQVSFGKLPERQVPRKKTGASLDFLTVEQMGRVFIQFLTKTIFSVP